MTVAKTVFSALFLATLLPWGGAAAQTGSALPTETVISEGQRAKDDAIVRHFVQSFLSAAPTLEGQYAKWKQKICPHVYGLTPVYSYVVEHRIREIAAQVGAPVDRDDPCIANIGVIFTSDPQKTFDAIAAKRPELVVGSPRRLKVLYPVQSWYATWKRDDNGALTLDEAWEDADPSLEVPPMVPANGSHLRTGITAEMGTATILVDFKAVIGLTLGSVADYVALLTLTESQVSDKCQDVPSIANLMIPGCDTANKSDGLSNVDMALLTALYSVPDSPELLQRQRIIGAMKRALNTPNGP